MNYYNETEMKCEIAPRRANKTVSERKTGMKIF